MPSDQAQIHLSSPKDVALVCVLTFNLNGLLYKYVDEAKDDQPLPSLGAKGKKYSATPVCPMGSMALNLSCNRDTWGVRGPRLMCPSCLRCPSKT